MMKLLLSTLVFLFFSWAAIAQLPNGQIAPDFTLTDIDGVDHHLYSYLDDGYIVFIEISATWCGPCWNYHNAGHLKQLYINHGPAGFPNVSENTTDKVMVLFVEGDPNTGMADLLGNTSSSMGNWIAGTPFPIIDPPGSIVVPWRQSYGLAFFPTIYRVCPNRTLQHVGQQNLTNLVNGLSNCPAPASEAVDAALLPRFDYDQSCVGNNLELKTRLQNNGTQPLTSATFTATSLGNNLLTYNWTGNLATYEWADISLGNVIGEQVAPIAIAVAATGDNNPNNNSFSQHYLSDLKAETIDITIKITTDRYGAETTWRVKNSAGSIVANGGPYTNMPSNGAYPQPDVNLTLPNDCYTFEVFDSYGDGMCCAYGAGGYQIVADGQVIASGGQFQDFDRKLFETEEAVNVYDLEGKFTASFFPNPFNQHATLSLNLVNAEQVKVEVINMLGQKVYFNDHGILNAGNYQLDMNLNNLSTGVYILNITVGDQAISQRITAGK